MPSNPNPTFDPPTASGANPLGELAKELRRLHERAMDTRLSLSDRFQANARALEFTVENIPAILSALDSAALSARPASEEGGEEAPAGAGIGPAGVARRRAERIAELEAELASRRATDRQRLAALADALREAIRLGEMHNLSEYILNRWRALADAQGTTT